MIELDRAGTANSVLYALISAARSHGIDATIESLRRSYVVNQELPTVQLLAIARDLGLDARRTRMKWRDLPRLHRVLPAILRMADGRAVVLENVVVGTEGEISAVLRDPTGGEEARAVVQETQLTEMWAGEVILLKKSARLKSTQKPFGFPWLLGQLLYEKALLRNIMVSSLLSTLFVLAPMATVWIVFDRVLVNHSRSTLYVVVGAIAFLIVFEMIVTYFERLFMEVISARINGRLNIYIMEKLLKLPMDFFEQNPTGKISSKIGQIWQIRGFLTGQLFGTLLELIPLLLLLPLMLVVEWHLALFVFAVLGVIFIIITVFMKPLSAVQKKVRAAENSKFSYLLETIYGMRTVKAMVLEGRRRNEWDTCIADTISTQFDYDTLANYPQTMVAPFERLIYPGAIVIGAFFALAAPGSIETGRLMAFSMIATRASAPLIGLAVLLRSWSEIGSTIEEVSEIMNLTPEGDRPGLGLRLPIRGHTTFQGVKFRYTPDTPLALDGTSFEIRPGTIFGIMGRSGSGKTTITRLLQGLNPSYEGAIKIDGMDLREIDLGHLRTNIGVVPQENFLFYGSVRQNIGIARPDASFDEIVRAAQLAGAEEFIENMPEGYDTILQEGGANLSGGQRQRMAIARALLVDPPVLILDEATSALDPDSESIINANLVRIARDRTIICVSHRLSMLVPADAILVMERGRVYDIGRHEELLHRCDIYKHMWYQQNPHEASTSSHAPLAIAHTATV